MNISPIIRKVASRYGLPATMKGPPLKRKEACDFCGSHDAILLAKMDYWDLSEHDLVECTQCGLMQIDPMLTEENLAIGCRAYYQFDNRSHGLNEIRRTCLRNFRKGISFGMDLKALGLHPKRSLELGAGDAYFSRGLKLVFPELEVCCLDVVSEILSEIKRHHGFETVSLAPEKITAEAVGTFDLVIGRDIVEHVRKPSLVFRNIYNILRPGGVFHFITPNGHEDVWFTYGFWQLHQEASEYLINHVSFFPTKTLRAKLEETGFELKRWIVFDFKGTFREKKGRKIDPKYLARPSKRLSAHSTIESAAKNPINFSSIDPKKLLSVPWMKSQRFAKIFCHSRHRPRWYCDADVGVGHEIYGIAIKPPSRE